MRQFERHPAALPVTVRMSRVEGEGSMHLDTADLSQGGAFLCSDLLFEVGEELEVEIALPSGAVVKTAARVARVARREADAVPGMGIEFTGITAQDRRLIQEGTPWQRPSRS
jgi:c-di-GMP-binding flagellar brake protein YcgR